VGVSTGKSGSVKIMKPAIILSGKSGSGKTTMMNYLESKYSDIFVFDGGDYDKARLALAYTNQLKHPYEMLLSDDSFNWFIENQLKEGVQLYEELKSSGKIIGKDIIQWIESERSLLPNRTSLMIQKIGNLYPDKHIVTTVINNQELGNHFSLIPSCFVAILNCKNPKTRNGDNRNLVDECYSSICFTYYLEESIDVADLVYDSFKFA
jgi:hypothetical protein